LSFGSGIRLCIQALVGDAVNAWERERPEQPNLLDRKTGESVAMLFCFRGQPIPTEYFNRALIPLLCGKAGMPLEDARGRITSHRARATIATQLFNAKEPMTLRAPGLARASFAAFNAALRQDYADHADEGVP